MEVRLILYLDNDPLFIRIALLPKPAQRPGKLVYALSVSHCIGNQVPTGFFYHLLFVA